MNRYFVFFILFFSLKGFANFGNNHNLFNFTCIGKTKDGHQMKVKVLGLERSNSKNSFKVNVHLQGTSSHFEGLIQKINENFKSKIDKYFDQNENTTKYVLSLMFPISNLFITKQNFILLQIYIKINDQTIIEQNMVISSSYNKSDDIYDQNLRCVLN